MLMLLLFIFKHIERSYGFFKSKVYVKHAPCEDVIFLKSLPKTITLATKGDISEKPGDW